jgi:hypothetical protein
MPFSVARRNAIRRKVAPGQQHTTPGELGRA